MRALDRRHCRQARHALAVAHALVCLRRGRSSPEAGSWSRRSKAATAASCPSTAAASFEIGGIKVDVSRQGLRTARATPAGASPSAGLAALCGPRTNTGRSPKRRTCPIRSSTDGRVGIVVEYEQIGPNRYIARAWRAVRPRRAGALLGFGGLAATLGADAGDPGERPAPDRHYGFEMPQRRGSAPGRSIRTAQQRDRLCPPSGHRRRPLARSTPAQARRPGAAGGGSIIDLYGASNVLIAEVQHATG